MKRTLFILILIMVAFCATGCAYKNHSVKVNGVELSDIDVKFSTTNAAVSFYSGVALRVKEKKVRRVKIPFIMDVKEIELTTTKSELSALIGECTSDGYINEEKAREWYKKQGSFWERDLEESSAFVAYLLTPDGFDDSEVRYEKSARKEE